MGAPLAIQSIPAASTSVAGTTRYTVTTDVQNGSSGLRAVTPVSLLAGLGMTCCDKSADTTLTSGMAITVSTTSGRKPLHSIVTLINQSADCGYSAGDEVLIPPYSYASTNVGYTMKHGASSATMQLGVAAVPLSILTNVGQNQNVDLTKWKIRLTVFS